MAAYANTENVVPLFGEHEDDQQTDEILSEHVDAALDLNGRHATEDIFDAERRPFRTTRGTLPARFKDSHVHEHVSRLQNMRSLYATNLSRICQRARQAVKDRRSRKTLFDHLDNIGESLATLSCANDVYVNSLTVPSLRYDAIKWMEIQQRDADIVCSELQQASDRSDILSRTATSAPSEHSISSHHTKPSQRTQLSGHSQTSQQLKLKAEQAALEARQAERRAAVNLHMAEMEATKIKQTADLAAQEEIERTQLKARGLHALAEAALQSEYIDIKPPDEHFSDEKSEYVNHWLSNQQTDPKVPFTNNHPIYQEPRPEPTIPHHYTHAAERPEMNSMNNYPSGIYNSRHNRNINPTAQTSAIPTFQRNTMPLPQTFQHHVNNVPVYQTPQQPYMLSNNEPVDAWIDRLIPGVETQCASSIGTSANHLTEAIIKLESERDLPSVELPLFDGSALMWPRFAEQFFTQVHCRPGINDTRRMDLLQSHLKGEACSLVRGLGYSGRNYAQALKELKNAFGHRVRVARAYLDTVSTGSIIPGDASALRQFYVSIRDCVITLQQLHYSSDLYSSDILLKTAKRLPQDKVAKWNFHVRNISRTREPNLIDLLNWLKDHVDAAYSPYAVEINKVTKKFTNNGYSNPKQGKRMTLNTTVQHTQSQSTPTYKHATTENQHKSSKESKLSTCPICSGEHSIYKCTKFLNMDIEERHKQVKQKKLCYNCLRTDHICSNCPSSVRCRESDCGQSHHTMLHRKPADGSTEAKVHSTRQGVLSDKTYFQLVSILTYGRNGRIIPTFALLDSASEISIIHEQLAKDLGLKGSQRNLTLKTLNSETNQMSHVVSLRVRSRDELDAKYLHIAEAWSVESSAFNGISQHVLPEWKHAKSLNIRNIDPSQVQMLIGINTPSAHIQSDIKLGDTGQPIAVRTMLGWSLIGSSADCKEDKIQHKVNLTVVQDSMLDKQLERFWRIESFGVNNKFNDKIPTSVEDRRSVNLLESTTQMKGGRYEVGMLWKRDDIQLPNNLQVAQRRLQSVLKRFNHDNNFKDLYVATLQDYITKGYARKMSPTEANICSSRTWYLPHHGVTNPNKPGKVRVVFDAAATYMNTSLNSNLMTGPDLLNNLFGVLLRFRLYPIALVADIESMFHQVTVPDTDSDSLRFLWKEDLSKTGPPDVYKMTVHIFGAADSPSCVNYALKRTAQDNVGRFNCETIQTVLNDFYMDDLLKSVKTPDEAVNLAKELTQLLSSGGFRLHKWISNSVAVMESIPESERVVQDIDLELNELPIQRALGLKWSVSEDCFFFDPTPRELPPTKRGVVSIVSSIFDPCGFLSPFTLRAKCFVQELWQNGIDWDEVMPENMESKWRRWLDEVKQLSAFKLPRHHIDLSCAKLIEAHVFSDASEAAYGAVAYLRYISDCDSVICSFVASKTRVAPLKATLSIPRLELQGALLAARLWNSLSNELNLQIERVVFWTDSNTVLRYLNNETRRFKPFVSNRVAEIHEITQVQQWRHVPSEMNPADYCSRGLPASALTPDHPWFQGPEYLWKQETEWPIGPDETIKEPDDDDPEIKTVKSVMLSHIKPSDVSTAGESFLARLTIGSVINAEDSSSLRKLVRLTAWLLRAVRNFASVISRFKLKAIRSSNLEPDEYSEAKLCWLRQAQQDLFTSEIADLESGRPINVKSSLSPLMPVYDGRHIRVGGRLHKANIPTEAKHQIILPQKHVITRLLSEEIHVQYAHCGQEHLIAQLRQHYWPISARRIAKQVIASCLYCRKQRISPTMQVMGDLPESRLSVSMGAFHSTGVDYFGPMMVKVRRSSVKRWGCLFTCLSTRAVHLELADSLETDDFILVLRNFIGRRGHPSCIYSDNGTNFVGANNELKKCLDDLKQSKVTDFLAPQGIEWHFSPPLAPHFGGAWERLVRSVKTALKATLKDLHVSDSVLRTALIEVEAVLNSRPLTHNSPDPDDYQALTPNHFLLGRADTTVPPDIFSDREINSRKKWRQSQVIANQIHNRWLKEYLPTLTVRNRWRTSGQMVSKGDLVLLADQSVPRGQWELARVVDTYPGEDNCVRVVKVKTAKSEYIRPVTKLCVLEENVN